MFYDSDKYSHTFNIIKDNKRYSSENSIFLGTYQCGSDYTSKSFSFYKSKTSGLYYVYRTWWRCAVDGSSDESKIVPRMTENDFKDYILKLNSSLITELFPESHFENA